MFDTTCNILNRQVHRYEVYQDGKPLTYANAMELLKHDEAFRTWWVALLADHPFRAYRWETPPIAESTIDRHFEFVLIDAPSLTRSPDVTTFAEHFATANPDGIAQFESLGKDALLIVPTPFRVDSGYDHLASFLRSAPAKQIHALWKAVGKAVQTKVHSKPTWLSTAGGGVAWLHVRLDSRPKYIGHTPYKNFSP